jgi:serine protease
LSWSAPVVGSYTFTVTAKTAAGASASGTYAVKVIAGTAPVISGTGKFSGTAGKAFTGTLSATNPNVATLTWSLSGAPSGLAITTAGAMSWAAPLAGSHTFTAKVTDSYGYSSTQTEVLTVAAAAAAPVANHAPTIAAATYTVKAGATFSTMLNGSDVDGGTLSYTIAGSPSGMKLLSSGFLYWVATVKGTYTMTVTVHDSAGATGSAAITLVVS